MDKEVLTMTIQCCQCKRVRAGEEWRQAEDLAPGAASYTYCPTCLSASVIQFNIERSERRHSTRPTHHLLQPVLGA